jgi:hypothetical protein
MPIKTEPYLLLSTICKLDTKGLHQHQASRLNIKNRRHHQYTWRKRQPQDNKSYPRSLDSSRPQFASWKPSNCWKIFLGTLGSLTPLTLKMSRRGFNRILSATSNLQLSTSANEDDLHTWQRQVFEATQRITGELEEQRLMPNSKLVSTPLTTTLRNLGTRFFLRGEEL